MLASPGGEIGRAVGPDGRFYEGRIDLGGAASRIDDEDLVVGAVAPPLPCPKRRADGGREAERERCGLRQGDRNVSPAEAAACAPRRLTEEAEAQVAVRREPAPVEERPGFAGFGNGLRGGAGQLAESRAGKEGEAEDCAGLSLRIRTGNLRAGCGHGLEDRDGVERVASGEGEGGVNRVEDRENAARLGDRGGEEGVGGVGGDCAGLSLRIRMPILDFPVVVEPDAEIAGDGGVGGVGDVEADVEGSGGIALRADHATRIVRL